MGERLASVSIDLDEIGCYAAIHGLPSPTGEAAHAVYRRGLERLAALLEAEGIPATFFVIGRDLDDEKAASALRALHRAGHELANHTDSHLYNLTRQSRETMLREVAACADRLSSLTGKHARGFRAPGYVLTDTLVEILVDLDIHYDSSVFPCPAYYSAKGLALCWMSVRRKKSRSILDDPRVLTAPADPYRLGVPYWNRGKGIVELPIGVTSDLTGRLPFIGTGLILAGERGARKLAGLAAGRPLVNLELHGIDLCDAEQDGLEFLRKHQPDLRKSADDKESALRAALGALRDAGYRFVTLAEAARAFAREQDPGP